MDSAVRGLAGRDGGGGEGGHSRAGTRSWGGREAEWVQQGAPRESRSHPGRGSPRGMGVREDHPQVGAVLAGLLKPGVSVWQRLGRRVGELPGEESRSAGGRGGAAGVSRSGGPMSLGRHTRGPPVGPELGAGQEVGSIRCRSVLRGQGGPSQPRPAPLSWTTGRPAGWPRAVSWDVCCR